jgi:hypothetical protein
MGATTPSLPDAPAIGTLLGSLAGRVVAAKRIPSPVPPRGGVVIGVYLHEDKTRSGLLWVDIPAGASLAAALTLAPAKMVEECVRAGRLVEPLDDNVREVFNICTRLFTGPDSPRVVLGDVHFPPARPPTELAALLLHPPHGIQVELSITGYKPGKMGLIAV